MTATIAAVDDGMDVGDTATGIAASAATPFQPSKQSSQQQQQSICYAHLVIDSGPILKHGLGEIMRNTTASQSYVTVPGVLAEIRDGRARQALQDGLYVDQLQVRTPTAQSMHAVTQFAKLTGDYPSLSIVDLQVLALTYELECEGCFTFENGMEHIRTTPKRTVGLGSIELLNQKKTQTSSRSSVETQKKQGKDLIEEEKTEETASTAAKPLDVEYDVSDGEEEEHEDDVDEEEEEGQEDEEADTKANVGLSSNTSSADIDETRQDSAVVAATSAMADPTANEAQHRQLDVASAATTSNSSTAAATTSWAALLGGSTNTTAPVAVATPSAKVADQALHVTFGSMNIASEYTSTGGVGGGGQFDDASDGDIDNEAAVLLQEQEAESSVLQRELDQEFPSLLAAATVPYEGEDDDVQLQVVGDTAIGNTADLVNPQDNTAQEDPTIANTSSSLFERSEEEKQKNLQPVSKSGKLYNSFRKYGNLVKPQPATIKKKTASQATGNSSALNLHRDKSPSTNNHQESKIMGTSATMAETMKWEEDDGEGWITSAQDIKTIKTQYGGQLDPSKTLGPILNENGDDADAAAVPLSSNVNRGPPLSQRTACATTDFAMQNVLLQMNLILVSVDGMRIRRLKSWVLRCGACFKIHSPEQGFLNGRMKRLFCAHCGSDMLQRISASVDGKTGRLKLHFSKRRQGKHLSTRGTKYSLPKPGNGNKYQGDLLLREDQLLMGAWNQKVKIRSGNTYQTSNSESIFGRDLASTVGCNVTKSGVAGSSGNDGFGSNGWASSSSANLRSSGAGATADHDIRVGFGARKNPNAAKGRERRGKKKKSTDRACGMRRY